MSSSCIRGQSHLLLVGDPGTGKSQLLRYAAQISDRSVLTTGIGTTSAGLTVSAVKDSGEWVLVLANGGGGYAALTNWAPFAKMTAASFMRPWNNRPFLLLKGEFVCSLHSRATVMAAMNPPHGFDIDSTLSVNVGMASSLLSRFDLILLLLDKKNDRWDLIVGNHIMNSLMMMSIGIIAILEIFTHTQFLQSSAPEKHMEEEEDEKKPCLADKDEAKVNMNEHDFRVSWSIDQMRAYFRLAKKRKVTISEGAQAILTRYYQLQRGRIERDMSRTTLRLLESLIRLARAHARLMYRDIVLPLDAIEAVFVMEKSLETSILDIRYDDIFDEPYNYNDAIFQRDLEDLQNEAAHFFGDDDFVINSTPPSAQNQSEVVVIDDNPNNDNNNIADSAFTKIITPQTQSAENLHLKKEKLTTLRILFNNEQDLSKIAFIVPDEKSKVEPTTETNNNSSDWNFRIDLNDWNY
ncbi:hypothetical protein RFI_37353 [Reticulomyxa filosa]|uniref:MCM C-terminal AAA(+) ATPase domain-containing protein n=1 Tax=Reticulomyxa filosa TaxID=46433 RepID=X6LFG0_RETFI|nr:hypothetical protein RFI_37353 [Reticulomyxa filosa]|eukprot:ETO00106.1 hypothetical protein RFI_37353 [Reticulomyxa filosa]